MTNSEILTYVSGLLRRYKVKYRRCKVEGNSVAIEIYGTRADYPDFIRKMELKKLRPASISYGIWVFKSPEHFEED